MKLWLILSSILCASTLAWAVDLPNDANLTQKMWQSLENPESTNISPQERGILGATLALKQNDPEKALQILNSPSAQNDPLANLLKAEAHRRAALKAVSSVGDYAKHSKLSKQQFAAIDLSDDLSEATVRLQAFADKVDGTQGFPFDVLKTNSHIQSIFIVDKSRSRMFVYQRDTQGEFQRVADEYIVTGAKGGDKKTRGDARTPNGIYRFTAVRHDPALRAKYGPVVFPIDYPNMLDRYHGKTGDGIWMHGYPENKLRRPPQDTRGCFALPNPNLKKMEAFVTPKQSLVLIGNDFSFGDTKKQQALLSSVQNSIQTWIQDWQSLDSDAYLSHYHEKFRSGKYNLKRWKSYKKRVNARKSFIEVQLNDINIIHDPNLWPEGEVVMVEFSQKYRSNNYNDTGAKRLYLARHDANQTWKILIEENL
ncbi:L,D-transpeptidase family protein [Ghiorsea bivora]|uniref:L,D-transpeptidase family protein n=1 Tax=Ghiorsea bivora TaxID=1485545 RepID=UPI00056FDF63|nr:L,D-transpeptidase family protein [Ghiorsea bivora]